MLKGFFILIACQLLGELIVGLAGLTIPGAVIGMIILFCLFLVFKGIPKDVELVGNGLLRYIGLLFVPAGAGISMFLALLVDEWQVILLAGVGGTLLTLIVSACVFQLFLKADQHDA